LIDVEKGFEIKPFLWFTLYNLMNRGACSKPTRISTIELAKVLGGSQQSASRHLRLLEKAGLISRRISSEGSLIRITDDGMRSLNEVYIALKRHLEGGQIETFAFEGVVFSGLYEGAYYISQVGYRSQIKEKLGFDPYPGTLNVRIKESDINRRKQLELLPGVTIHGFKDRERAFGSARCYPLMLNDEVDGALIVANRTTYDLSVMEIISPVYLRKHLSLKDGDLVKISIYNKED